MTASSHPGSWHAQPALRAAVLCGLLACLNGWPGVLLWGLCLVALHVAAGLPAKPARPVREATPAEAEPLSTQPGAPGKSDAAPRAISPRGHPRAAEPRLAAHFDPLTGLASAAYASDMAQALMQGWQARQLSLCVLHVTLEGLDGVVGRYGPRAGDDVLRQAARRLRHVVREDDLIVRWGGTGFVLLLACPVDQSALLARTWAQRVTAELQRPLSYRTVSNLHIGWNIGSAVWPLHGESLGAVIGHAEAARAQAQRGGRGQTRHHVAADEAAPQTHP